MNVHAKLDEITSVIEGARAMPMSASCIVNRAEVLALLDEMRELLPTELDRAADVLRDREAVVEEGRQEAQRIIEEAAVERTRMLAKTEIVKEASQEADRMRAEAQSDADRMRADVDDYVDTKLANFEVVLHKTLQAVERGRAKLGGQSDLGGAEHDLGAGDGASLDDAALPG